MPSGPLQSLAAALEPYKQIAAALSAFVGLLVAVSGFAAGYFASKYELESAESKMATKLLEANTRLESANEKLERAEYKLKFDSCISSETLRLEMKKSSQDQFDITSKLELARYLGYMTPTADVSNIIAKIKSDVDDLQVKERNMLQQNVEEALKIHERCASKAAIK